MACVPVPTGYRVPEELRREYYYTSTVGTRSTYEGCVHATEESNIEHDSETVLKRDQTCHSAKHAHLFEVDGRSGRRKHAHRLRRFVPLSRVGLLVVINIPTDNCDQWSTNTKQIRENGQHHQIDDGYFGRW